MTADDETDWGITSDRYLQIAEDALSGKGKLHDRRHFAACCTQVASEGGFDLRCIRRSAPG